MLNFHLENDFSCEHPCSVELLYAVIRQARQGIFEFHQKFPEHPEGNLLQLDLIPRE